MAVNNEYVNRVDANGQTLIDLTNDTATAGDVLEGHTLHLASGAPATGTYRPGDEIEARLEATVGHSSKNLLPITLESGTYTSSGANLTYTVDKVAGTITLNGTTRTSGTDYLIVCDDVDGKIAGQLYLSGGYDENARLFCFDVTANAYPKQWDGVTSSVASKGENDSVEELLIAGHNNQVRLRFYAGQSFNNVVLKPMLRDGSISDDTFEPYVTPTDEKKQDKPVVLWAWDSANPVQTVSLSALSDSILNYSIIKIFFNWRSIFSCIEGDAEILYGTEIPRAYFGTTLYDVDPSFSSASISLDCPQTAINLYAHRIGDGADLTHNCAIVKIIGIP